MRRDQRTLLVSLGSIITERRDNLGLTQTDLAVRSGVDRSFISHVERGKRNPSFALLVDIAAGLDVSTSILIRRAEKRMRELERA